MAKDLIPVFGSMGTPAIRRFRDRLDSLFDQFFEDFFDFDLTLFEDMQPKSNFPKINVIDLDDKYEVEIAVAGFTKDDIKLELKDNDLIISASKANDENDSSKKYLKREISFRSFKRIVRFPIKVDPESAHANYEDGIIKFSIDKKDKNDKNIKIIDIK